MIETPERRRDRGSRRGARRAAHRSPGPGGALAPRPRLADGHRRSLGVPAADPATLPRISLATLIPSWLPLRPPSVHLVAEVDGELVGACRAIRSRIGPTG